MHALILSLVLTLTANQIVDRHIEARGGAARIAAVRTLVYRNGTYHEGDYTGSGTAYMAFARPYYRVVGDPESAKRDIMEGYDGSPWEYYAKPGVVVRTVSHAAGASRRGTSIDWRLGELRANGATIARCADEPIGGRAAYCVAQTTPDGFVHESFFDQETFLTLADRYRAPVHAYGESVTTEGRYSDWRSVDGILFPFRVYEADLATGKELNSMQWGAIEINRELPAAWFSPPPFLHSRLQTMLEQLYMERTDVVSVLWTYDEFHRVYPDVDTHAGIEFIARQMRKMGDDTAADALVARIKAEPASPAP